MAKKLHEGAPPSPSPDMGGKDFGLANPDSWSKHRGVKPGNAAKHRKEAEEMRKKHRKRV